MQNRIGFLFWREKMNNLFHHCGYPNCREWVQGNNRYCDKHHAMRQAEYQHVKDERQKMRNSSLYNELIANRTRGKQRHYNLNRRDAESIRFYRSGQWKQIRDYRIAYDQYTCQCCGNNYQASRLTADHIVMRKLLSPKQQLDWHNLWTLCNRCNAVKQQLEIKFQKKGKVEQLKSMSKSDWKKMILEKEKIKNTPAPFV